MSTQIATQQAPTDLTPAQEQAWLGMALAKNQIAANLTQAELKAQSILLPVSKDSSDYKVIDAACANYRKAHTDMIELRKTFTSLIDTGIVQPLMAFEKRVDPKTNAVYITLQNASLHLRQEETKRVNEGNAKTQEKARFTAHCANEFYRVNEDLRQRIRAEINNQYKIHLEQRISPEIDDIKLLISKMQPTGINKFGVTVLTNDELLEIFTSLKKPEISDVFSEGNACAETLFANFDSDLANAAAAIAYNQQQAALELAESNNNMATEMAMNTLIAASESVVVDTPKIKKTLTITVVESEQWAKSIMAAFIIHLQNCSKYIRIKSWANLSIGQMAEALAKLSTETGITYSNITLKDVEK